LPDVLRKAEPEQLGFSPLLQSNSEKKTEAKVISHKKKGKVGEAYIRSELAPMLRQYLEIKDDYQDHVLFFQVGDFYEVFFDDAEIVANALQIRLTSRDKKKSNPIPMCGVPQHAIDNYIPKLLDKGFSCVMVSQLEDAKKAKGMVKRGITRIITPGVRYDGDGLDAKKFNYLASILSSGGGSSSVSYIDISTGRLRTQETESVEEACEVLLRLMPSEVVLPMSLNGAPVDKKGGWLQHAIKVCRELDAKIVYRPFEFQNADEIGKKVDSWLVDFEHGNEPKQLIKEVSPVALCAMSAALFYVEEVSFGCTPVLSHFGIDEVSKTVFIDNATRRNLELTETRIDGERKNSLIQHIDCAKTAMGSRQLREWVLCPITEKSQIEARHNSIDELLSKPDDLKRLRELFVAVRDIDRLCSRITGMRANPRDLRILLESIEGFDELQEKFLSFDSSLLKTLSENFDALKDIREKLEVAIVDEPPVRVSDGGIFRTGYHVEVDKLRKIRSEGRNWLAELEAREKKKTGISALKIKYNNVFGYFIEISKAHLAKVPDSYQRKQTLTNAERFVTQELKERETEILSAKVRQLDIEREVFFELRSWLAERIARLQKSSRIISTLDVLCSLAYLARQNKYIRPTFTEDSKIEIVGGRHPVVERIIGVENFIPNNCSLDTKNQSLAILTGPNMGGKSTYLRQVGLIQLLAQAGSFVPADSAEIGIVDRIFTRIGAADDLSRGDSTFMVEMREAATIIRKATSSSLVLIDEIGRGTATADGLALALSIAECLHDSIKCRTIFATHFHELTGMLGDRKGCFSLAVGVIEKADEIVFTHRIENKVADKSFGLEVAKLAGLPDSLLLRARTVLESLELESLKMHSNISANIPAKPKPKKAVKKVEEVKENLSAKLVLERLDGVNPNTLTPFDALSELVQLKRILKGDKT